MRGMIKYQISTETAISLFRVQIFFPYKCSVVVKPSRTRIITDRWFLLRSFHSFLFSSHLHTVSRFLLSTAALVPGPRLRMGCDPTPGDAIRAWSPALVFCSRVEPAASVTLEEP